VQEGKINFAETSSVAPVLKKAKMAPKKINIKISFFFVSHRGEKLCLHEHERNSWPELIKILGGGG
jgi:hypothetical protein